MNARIYLRASTTDQDANRALKALKAFAADHGLVVVATYRENESGAKLDRPELFRLLADALPGDVLLVEQIDRLSRLTDGDWRVLRGEIEAKQVRIVALDLPTSWALASSGGDEFTSRMFAAVNGLMLDMLAAIARKDYADRKRRQAEGIEVAKTKGAYVGKPEDVKRNAAISKLLKAGLSWSAVMAASGCSRATVAKAAAQIKAADRTL